SIKFMQQAIEYEARRQIDLIEEGKSIDQETRLFDTKKQETRSMRSKEDAHDYRYFPDPDLLPLQLEQNYIETIKKSLPELPDQKKQRLISEFKLSNYEASVIISDQAVSSYYEEVAKNSDYKLAATWIMGELFAILNKEGKEISESPVSSSNLAKMINLIKDGTISGKIAKTVFEEMVKSNKDPSKIVEEKGLKQTSDPKEIENIIDEILSANQDKVEQYKSGKDKLFGFFVGQVMKEMKGKGNPQMINDILKNKLK
ncbi:MAG: Asp-tRNA(Asn)/Glu-tRNA(Gln) amidotransferase GatCAB subunit B, partial [Pelagibacteraceae bacterium]